MKGTIVKCLENLVIEKFGQDKWNAIVARVPSMPKAIMPISDIDDTVVLAAVKATCEVLGITATQAADAFGEYWVNVYAQQYYASYFQSSKTARELILNMDKVHDSLTKSMKNARPPRFQYEWKNEKTLIFHYTSHRHLIDFAVGLIKGVGTFYREKLIINKLSEDKLEVVFS